MSKHLIKNTSSLKTEQQKIGYIISLITLQVSESIVRKEVGRVFNIGKSARNAKYNKISRDFYKENKTFTSDGSKFYKVNVEGSSDKIYTTSANISAKKSNKVFQVNGDKAVAEVKNVTNIVTVEDLIAYANIDMNIWEVVKSSANVWNEMWQIKAEFKRKVDEQNFNKLLEVFIQQANDRAPKQFKVAAPINSCDELYVISIQDLHIGKLAHGKQTLWGDFDIGIAKKFYRDAAEELINKAPVKNIGKILIIIGSDMIHYENQRVETTSGTKIEGDSRWHKVFDESCQLVAETVELLASQFEVEVMVVAGNHANLSEYAMGAYIKAFFRHHPNVNVNNEPSNRKYYGHGKTLIGFAHGDGVKKLEDLGAVMMREQMDVISNYKHLYWLTGHKHTFTQMMDSRGVRIFISAALCNPDQWHSANNFTGNVQNSEGYLFSPDNGLSQIIFTKPVNLK